MQMHAYEVRPPSQHRARIRIDSCMRQNVAPMSSTNPARVSAWKEIWKGALQAIGAFVVTVIVSRLAALISPLRHWEREHIGSLVAPGRIDLTVFLGFLAICLLGLFVAARVTL